MAKLRTLALTGIAALALFWNTAYGQYNGRAVDKNTGKGIDSVLATAYDHGGLKHTAMSDANGNYLLDLTTGINDDTGVKPRTIKFSNIESRVQIQTPLARKIKVNVFNISGQKIAEYEKENNNQITFSTQNLSSGAYAATIDVDGEQRNTLLSIVDGKLRGNTSMKPLAAIKTFTQGVQGKLSKLEGAIIDSIRYTGKNIMDLFKTKPIITGNTIETAQVTPAITIDGTCYGVHPDSTKPYTLGNATVNIWELVPSTTSQLLTQLGNNIGTTNVTSDGKFNIKVQKNVLANKWYAIEVIAPGHHKKKILTYNKNLQYDVDPLRYTHVIQGDKNETRDQHALNQIIDTTYFMTVVKGTDGTDGWGGPPLYKWAPDADGYARPKIWVQKHPTDATVDTLVNYIIKTWKDSVDAGVLPTQVSDSTGAQIKVYFEDVFGPNLKGNAGLYGVYRDPNAETITGAVVYMMNQIATVQPNNQKSREALIYEELTQATNNLHDIGIEPYNSIFFYGDNKTAAAPSRPTDYERKNIFSPRKQLPKGW